MDEQLFEPRQQQILTPDEVRNNVLYVLNSMGFEKIKYEVKTKGIIFKGTGIYITIGGGRSSKLTNPEKVMIRRTYSMLGYTGMFIARKGLISTKWRCNLHFSL